MFLQTDEKELGIELQENERMENRGMVGSWDKKSMLHREARLTETQGSWEKAFYPSREELRETGEQNIFKIIENGQVS